MTRYKNIIASKLVFLMKTLFWSRIFFHIKAGEINPFKSFMCSINNCKNEVCNYVEKIMLPQHSIVLFELNFYQFFSFQCLLQFIGDLKSTINSLRILNIIL